MADETFTKADLDAAIKAAIEKEVSGLKEKNEELIADNKKLKSDLRKTQDIKPEDMAALESELEQAKAKLTEATKAAKEATSAREKAEKALASEQSVTHKLIAENGLVEALTKAGVSDPAYLDAVKALHFAHVKVVADGDTRKAMYGDKALDEAIKEWAASDVGKKFVAAPANHGGGSQGGDRGKSSSIKTMTRGAYDALDQNAKAELGPQMAKGELRIVDEAA